MIQNPEKNTKSNRHRCSNRYFIQKDGKVLTAVSGKGVLDYCNIRSCEMNIMKNVGADVIRIKVLIDGNSMYENEISLEDTIVF